MIGVPGAIDGDEDVVEHDALSIRSGRSPRCDGRVVLVRLTDAGAAALDDFRRRASAALGALLVELPDSEVESLAAATETMGRLVALLQQGR